MFGARDNDIERSAGRVFAVTDGRLNSNRPGEVADRINGDHVAGNAERDIRGARQSTTGHQGRGVGQRVAIGVGADQRDVDAVRRRQHVDVRDGRQGRGVVGRSDNHVERLIGRILAVVDRRLNTDRAW